MIWARIRWSYDVSQNGRQIIAIYRNVSKVKDMSRNATSFKNRPYSYTVMKTSKHVNALTLLALCEGTKIQLFGKLMFYLLLAFTRDSHVELRIVYST